MFFAKYRVSHKILPIAKIWNVDIVSIILPSFSVLFLVLRNGCLFWEILSENILSGSLSSPSFGEEHESQRTICGNSLLWQPGIDAPCRACSRFTMMVLVHMIIFRYKRMFCSFYILFCRLPNKSFSSFTQPCFHKELLPSWVCSEAPSSPSSWRPTRWVGRLQKGSDAPRGRKMSWRTSCC